MDIDVRTRDGVTIVELEGQLDTHNARIAQRTLVPLVHDGRRLVLVLRKVPSVSAAGLRLLLVLTRRAEAYGGRLVLAEVPTEICELMDVTGFLESMHARDRLEDAINDAVGNALRENGGAP